jgi:hypothetical protein
MIDAFLLEEESTILNFLSRGLCFDLAYLILGKALPAIDYNFWKNV